MCESRAVEANSPDEGLRWLRFTAGSKKCLMSQELPIPATMAKTDQRRGGEGSTQGGKKRDSGGRTPQNLVTLPGDGGTH